MKHFNSTLILLCKYYQKQAPEEKYVQPNKIVKIKLIIEHILEEREMENLHEEDDIIDSDIEKSILAADNVLELEASETGTEIFMDKDGDVGIMATRIC